jgi:hypothetical protein
VNRTLFVLSHAFLLQSFLPSVLRSPFSQLPLVKLFQKAEFFTGDNRVNREEYSRKKTVLISWLLVPLCSFLVCGRIFVFFVIFCKTISLSVVRPPFSPLTPVKQIRLLPCRVSLRSLRTFRIKKSVLRSLFPQLPPVESFPKSGYFTGDNKVNRVRTVLFSCFLVPLRGHLICLPFSVSSVTSC